jgi:hypothetical protein
MGVPKPSLGTRERENSRENEKKMLCHRATRRANECQLAKTSLAPLFFQSERAKNEAPGERAAR